MVRVNVPVRRMYGYASRGTARQEQRDRSKIRRDKKYVLEGDVRDLQRKDFLQQVGDPSKDLFVFAHGYNQSFADSVIYAAQLCADLEEISDGDKPVKLTPLVLSWPSVMRYPNAVKAADTAGNHFASELDLIADIRAKRRHLIAYSMGCRLVFALLARVQANKKASLFHSLILASPDVPIVDFNRHLEVERNHFKRVVTFSNSGDKVLLLASMLDALTPPRAGLRPSDVDVRHSEIVDTGLFPPASLTRFPVEGLFRHSDFSSVAIARLTLALTPT